jgi:hypothetical protein
MTREEAEALPEEKLHEALAAAVKAKDPALPEALAKSTNKAVVRAAKKALYQLKSSGVAVVTEAPKGELPHVQREVEELPALLSAISGTGERALFFVKARAGGGLDSYQAVVHDEQGILQLDRGEAQRSKYRRHLEAMRKNQPSVIETSLERALEELGVAWSLNGHAKQPLPPEAESHLRRLGVVALPGWPAPPQPEAADEALAARAAALHDEREIASWLPGVNHLKVLSARLDEVDSSVLQLTEPQKHEQRLQKAALTATELNDEERRTWAMRLWRTAELFEKTGRGEKAAAARAEARRLYHAPKVASRFLEKMFEKVVAFAEESRAQQLAQQQQQQGAAAPPPPEKSSPGGLIMP